MKTVVLTLFGESYIPEPVVSPTQKRNRKEPAAKVPGTPKKEDAPMGILSGWKAEKSYYTIGEVAVLFEVKTSSIRFWTKTFALHVRTNKKGDRLYAPEQIDELRVIYHLLRERGFTLAGAKAKLKEDRQQIKQTLHLKVSLQKLRLRLVTLRDQL